MIRILFVDDDEDSCFLLNNSIEKLEQDISLTCISDGDEAYKIISDFIITYDFYILDYNLNCGVDGIDLYDLLLSNKIENEKIMLYSTETMLYEEYPKYNIFRKYEDSNKLLEKISVVL